MRLQAPTGARLEAGAIIAPDGARLGLSVWPAEEPRAVVLAVHGMNDYAAAFDFAGAWWADEAQITTYAYDQRGFGRSPGFGRWPGRDTLIADLRAAIYAVRGAHPDLPLFVIGHSMGAAVVLAAAAEAPLDVDGVILGAPGLWGGGKLPLPYRAALNVAAFVAPGKTLTGERAGRQATDNIELLRRMWNDPLVVKETRLDAVRGVVRLMGAGWRASARVDGRFLVLIGERDEIIPLRTMKRAAHRLCGPVETRVYPESWHLLFADLGAEVVWRDAADWIAAQSLADGGVAAAAPGAGC